VRWLSQGARQSTAKALGRIWYAKFSQPALDPLIIPLKPSVYVAAYPYWHQLSLPPSAPEEEVVNRALYQLDLLFSQQIRPQDVAAILIEPVLGEGGYVPAPASFLRSLREICDKHGILLIVDEIQTGFGRTGKYFASEYSGVRPDILTIAKVL